MTNDTPTTLYRLFDESGDLLYVGIAGNPGRRFEQHKKDKPWWGDVMSLRLEHFPTRQDALTAELAAIRSENPRHNIVGKSGTPVKVSDSTNRRHYGRSTDDEGPPRYFCRDAWGHDRSTSALALVWEADYAAVSDDFYTTDDPHEVFDAWTRAIAGKYDEWVPIYWFVDGISFETAPFSHHNLMGQDFLSFFTWPTDIDGNPINWLDLPMDHAKSWFLPAATGWSPSPYQPSVNIATLKMAERARRGIPSWRAPLPGDERRGAHRTAA